MPISSPASPSNDQAELPLVGSSGEVTCVLRISRRPRDANAGRASVLSDEQAGQRAGAIVSLVEGNEYRYELLIGDVDVVSLEPSEVFDPDDAGGLKGRLRPGLYTGTMTIKAHYGAGQVCAGDVEIRSSKLSYLDDYRWMLTGLAAEGAELLMQRFGPSHLDAFSPDDAEDARTLYQRFAFLQTVLASEEFHAAMGYVLARPHQAYEAIDEDRDPRRGIAHSRALVGQFVKPGRRLDRGPLAPTPRYVPEALVSSRHAATTDTDPNRFVRFVLEHWRRTVAVVRERLAREPAHSSPVRRGVREADALLDELDALLAEELFRSVSALTHFPASSQVLQKREGYRELARAFVQGEAASRVIWSGSEDVFSAGQRDVASLYEYWAYVELRSILESLCDDGFEADSLFEVERDGLVLNLRRGVAKVLSGSTVRRHRRLFVELWFNRTFSSESWSKRMRPDCSIRVSVAPSYPEMPNASWLHFDAKYRIDSLQQIFEDDDDEGRLEDAARGTARRADLLKMHAYRDAIHRSAGAYVLYPGDSGVGSEALQQFHEILPGIGAFAMRPSPDGHVDPRTRATISRFLNDVFEHLADQSSSRERATFWADRSYVEPSRAAEGAVGFISQPPADTSVLLGFVRSAEHLDWVLNNSLYNLRADERDGSVAPDSAAVSTELVLVYGPELQRSLLWRRSGPPVLMTADELQLRGYRSPGGHLYCCLPIEQVDEFDAPSPATVSGVIERLAPGSVVGSPLVVRWSDL